jgi:hypothetical protein
MLRSVEIKMNEYNKLLKEVDNLKRIYLPKLEFIINSGNSSTIHDALIHNVIIDNIYHLALKYHERNDSKDIEYLIKCKEKILFTINWLEKIATK